MIRTTDFEKLQPSEVGLIEGPGRSLCFAWMRREVVYRAVVFPTPAVERGRHVHAMFLNEEEACNWPNVLVFDDCVLSPDISSAEYGVEVPERALVATPEGHLCIAVRGHSLGAVQGYFDPVAGQRCPLPNAAGYWFFTRWAVTVPDRLSIGTTKPIFSVDLGSLPA